MTAVDAGGRSPEELAIEVLQDPGGAEDAQGFLAPIRATCPVFAGPSNIYLVTGYEEARSVYRQPGVFSNAGGMANEAEWYERYARDKDEAQLARTMFSSMMFTSDGEDHSRRRALVRDYFSSKATARRRPMIEAIVADLIDGVRGLDRFDACRMLGFPLPERVICEILGAPYADFAQWERWAHVIGEFPRTRPPTEAEVHPYIEASMGFLRYFSALIDERAGHRGDDLISVMIEANAVEQLSRDELVANIVLIISAGHDTTANMVANGLYWLLRNPDEYRKLRAAPDLVPAAVEEMLRYEPSASFPFPRSTLGQGEVEGAVVPDGAIVMVANHAANRDPDKFADPDRFDVERYVGRSANPHMAFGWGTHRCIGEHLARAELEILFRAVVTELPELELVEKGPWRHGFHRHMERLIVGPAPGAAGVAG